jgi:hypothetical protein
MHNHRIAGMDEVHPSIKDATVVIVVMLMLCPTSNMVSLILSSVSFLGSVRKYEPMMTKVSSSLFEVKRFAVISE